MSSRSVTLTLATDISDAVPMWAWSHGGKGRIQVGTLSMFAGRPAAGKSTAARWLAAQFTQGTVPGCWEGRPQNVAYIAGEESIPYAVKPGLRAAGADFSRVFFPTVNHNGKHVQLRSTMDAEELTSLLREKGISVVIVDPIMSTIGSKVDVHRSNQAREYIEPWARIAEEVNGLVIGVVHLTKAPNGDVVAGINGSSAFGEVARSVFAFAKDQETGERILSQAKNSAGEEDLSLVYRIESKSVVTDSGEPAEVGTFAIIGDSDRTVADVLQDTATGSNTEVTDWLADHLQGRRIRSRDVKHTARAEGFSSSSIDRAAKKLRIVKESEGFPRVTYWSLPGAVTSQSHQHKRPDVTDATDATGHSHTTVTPVTSVTPLQENGDVTADATLSPLPGSAEGARRTDQEQEPRMPDWVVEQSTVGRCRRCNEPAKYSTGLCEHHYRKHCENSWKTAGAEYETAAS